MIYGTRVAFWFDPVHRLKLGVEVVSKEKDPFGPQQDSRVLYMLTPGGLLTIMVGKISGFREIASLKGSVVY